MTAITPKSVIFDFADNYGGSYLGVRSFDFFYQGNIITLTASDFTVYATSTFYYNNLYDGSYLFITALSKIGDGSSWISDAVASQQRVIIVFNNPIQFDSIVASPFHNSGVSSTTLNGAKNTVIQISDSAITDTTYGADISDGVQIFSGVLDQHPATDTEYLQELGLDINEAFDPSIVQDSNKFKFTLPDDTEFDDTTESAVPLYFSSSAGSTSFDLTAVFDDLGANSDKIAILNSSEDTQYQIEIVSWDETTEVAELLVLLPAGSAEAEFVFCHDSAQVDNTGYITTGLGTAAWTGDLVAWSAYAVVYDQIRAMTSLSFSILEQQRQQLYMYFGQQMRRMIKMYFGSYNIMRQMVKLPIVNNPVMRQMTKLPIAYQGRMRQMTRLEWSSRAAMRQMVEQVFSVADAQMRVQVLQQFDALEADQVRGYVQQLFSLAAGGSVVHRHDLDVRVENDNKEYQIQSFFYLMQEKDWEQYCQNYELKLKDYSEFLLFKHLTTSVSITINGEVCHLVPELPRKSRGYGSSTYIVPLASKSVLLDRADSEYSVCRDDELSGMASKIIARLAAPVCTVDFQIEDTYFPPGTFYANGKTNMALIKEVAGKRGAVVQSDNDGNLVIMADGKRRLGRLHTYEPDVTLCDQFDIFTLDQSHQPGEDYDTIYLSDQSTSDASERPEHEQIASDEYEEKLYLVPWSDEADLLHSGGEHVVVLKNGIVVKLIDGEEVEFVGGESTLSHPVYEIESVQWEERDLGAVAFLEAGNLTAEVADNSLATISYWTKYHSFTVINQKAERLQVYPEVN